MRILLVDDHPLFSQALAATVSKIGADIEVGRFETLAGVRAALAADADVALILLDLKLPDSQGVGGLLALKAHFPHIPVAVISASDDAETIQTVIACGAAGFVSKAVGVEELSAAIDALVHGETWFHGSAESDSPGLSAAQTRILDGVYRGLMNKQIAWELGLSEATVKYHLTGIFRSLGVRTRAQLVALARERPSAPGMAGPQT